MKLFSTVYVLSIVLASTPAFADDHKSAYTNAGSNVSSIRDWSGAYVGVGLSYNMGSYSTTGGTAYQAADSDGVGFVTTLGYLWQDGAFVYGAEIMGNMANADGTGAGCGLGGATTCRSNMDDYLAARVRVGYAFDSTLLFATLGYTSDRQGQIVLNGGVPVGSDSVRHSGATIGLGVEQALSDRLSVRGDIEYYHYDAKTYNLASPSATTIRPSTTAVSISLVNRF